MLRRLAGPETTFAVDLFGEILDGEDADAVGIVWRCVPDDQLLPVSQEMAGQAAAGPPELVARIKASIKRRRRHRRPRDAMLYELDPQAWSRSSPTSRPGWPSSERRSPRADHSSATIGEPIRPVSLRDQPGWDRATRPIVAADPRARGPTKPDAVIRQRISAPRPTFEDPAKRPFLLLGEADPQRWVGIRNH